MKPNLAATAGLPSEFAASREPVIVGACRTAIGGFQGALAGLPAWRLGEVAVRGALERGGVAVHDVDEVILGNVLQAGQGQGPARQAALAAGLPVEVPATTVNKVCGSGMKAVIMAAQAVMLGDARVVVAGGMESMSQAPYLLGQARSGYRLGNGTLVDSVISDGLWCSRTDVHMGITAENLADQHGITREEQDAFALWSQQRAERAIGEGRFEAEIVPVMLPARKGPPAAFVRDEHPRAGSTLAGLAALRPAFRKDGTVTAGNASGINDGAAAVVVASRGRADELGLPVLARVVGYGQAGVEPRVMGIGPVEAVRRALGRAGRSIAEVELWELNEAFAVQSLAVTRELGVDPAIVNVNGGAIALGHPIGASGTRILVTLLHEMRRRGARLGVAGLCIGGGMGIAAVVEVSG
jgi:acetyl-CoA C-acetyltransferase